MQNYKKSFLFSVVTHLLIASAVVFLILFVHHKHKIKETFTLVHLFRISKIVSKPHKNTHIKSIQKRRLVKHKIKHIEIAKKIVRHHIIRHVVRHVKIIRPILRKQVVIKHKSIKKITLKAPAKKKIKHVAIKPLLKPHKEIKTAIAKNSTHPTINQVVAQKIKHNYFDYLYQMINSHKIYPMIARRLEQTGIVRVGFVLLNDGEILHVKVVKSSGFSTLDSAAKAILTQLHQLKPTPKTFSRKPMHFTIPIVYSLK